MDIQSEVMSSVGRIDVVLSTKARIFVIELKLQESGKHALEQIRERRYYEKYLHKNKPIALVGIAFRFKDKKLNLECAIEEIPG